MTYDDLTKNEKLAYHLGREDMVQDIEILKECIKVLIRWTEPEMREDIANMKVADSDKACDSYKKDFRKIVECLTENPDLQIL